VLPDLLKALRIAEPFAWSYKVSALAHKSNRSTERSQLYVRTSAAWKSLGGNLTVPRSSDGQPGGSAMQFFIAVLSPVMNNKTPKKEGLKKIIKGDTGVTGPLGRVPDVWPLSDEEKAQLADLRKASLARKAALTAQSCKSDLEK
jgi:hypothetical protein